MIAKRIGGAVGALALAMAAGLSCAQGTVQQLSGTVSVQKQDGSLRLLSRQSVVGSGDTLNTERDSYAQVKFSDGAVMTLKPNTRIRIENFVFDEQQPARDNSALALLKGGLRMITGLIGKRGNQDALKLGTATATIGIRGTTFTVDDCITTECVKRGATRTSRIHPGSEYARLELLAASDAPDASIDPEGFAEWMEADRTIAASRGDPFALMGARFAQAPAQSTCDACVPPAVYVGVSDGEIVLTNDGGSANFRAGEFGAAASFRSRPSTLPGDPGLPIVTPPSAFFQLFGTDGEVHKRLQCSP